MTTGKMIAAALRVLEAGPLSALSGEGPPRILEEAFCRRFGVSFAVSYNSGTSALWAALFAAGVRPGDEVVAPAFAPAYAVATILHFRALPVLADVNPLTLTIDPESVAHSLTGRTRAVVAVDLAGHPADLDGLRRVLAERAALPGTGGGCGSGRGRTITLIEDGAQAFGAVYRGEPTGHARDGEIACFSLQESKNLSGGEGGILLTQDRDSYERACLAGQHPARLYDELKIEQYHRFWETGLGLSLRIHPVAAAIALAGLEDAEERLRRRRENAQYVSARLAELRLPGLAPTYVAPGCAHAYNVQPLFYRAGASGASGVTAGARPGDSDALALEEFVAAVRACGVAADVFPDPVYETTLFRRREFFGLGGPWEEEDAGRGLYDRDRFPGAETARRTAFFLGGETLAGDRAGLDQVVAALAAAANQLAAIKQEKET